MKTKFIFFILLYNSTYIFGQALADTLGNASLKNEDSTTIKITRLNINSDKSDFSPFMLNNQLLFVSGRNKYTGIQYVDKNGDTEITDIYAALKTDSIKFKTVKSFDAAINTKYYEGPFCFNKKGTIIYFTANDKRSNLLKIYKSEKINDAWTKPEPMPFCTGNFSFCHPSLSSNEDFMVFASNINSEKNKMDIYMSENDNGIWGPPVSLSNKINDTYNQVFPFIASNNILYFSSDKPGGAGGLDIYYIDLKVDTASAKALPLPINSSTDDFGVWIDTTLASGYLSSNRNAKFKDDIYYFSKIIPDFSNWKKIISKDNFCYTFFEESTLASKDTLNMTYEWDFGDGTKGRGLKTKHCFASYGDYFIQLNIIDKNSGEVFLNETSSTLSIEKPDKLVIDCADTIHEGEEVVLFSKNCYLKGYELNKMYWSFGDGKYNSGSFVKHKFTKPGTYKIEMGLQAKKLNSDKVEHFRVEKNITVMNK